MEPLPATRPAIRNLFLWLSIAAPLLFCVTKALESSAVPGAGNIDTQERLRFDLSGKRSKGGLDSIGRVPAVLPDLVTREIYLPRKSIAPPVVMAGRVEKPSKALMARIRLSKRAKIKPVNRHYRRLIHEAASRHGVEPAMIQAIIMAESSFNPKAVSRRGALGLMQLMPQTAESLGVADALDPGKNIDAGARYLRQLLNHFSGDIELALAAYNAGIQNVLDHNGIPPYKATRSYVEKVLTYYEHYKRRVTS